MDTIAVYGGTATFSVTATSGTTLSYQWYKDGLLILDQLLPGQTASTLTLTNVGASDVGHYFVEVRNAGGTVDSRKALLTVGPNTPPVANDDTYTTLEDLLLAIPVSGVLTNDSDLESAITAMLVGNVSNGSLTLSTNGSFTYQPNTNFNGSDSFTYRAWDDGIPVQFIAQQNTTGGNKFEIKSGKMGAQSFRHGTAGAPSYSITKLLLHLSRESSLPNANLNFNIGTGTNAGAIAGSSVAITPASITNTSSGSSFQPYELVFGTPVGPLTAGTTYYLNFESAASKRCYVERAGSSTYAGGTYYENSADKGQDIWFQICSTTNSPSTNSGIATVTINVTPVNDPPVAVNDSTNTLEDVSVAIQVLGNDSDVEGSPLTITGTTTTNGTAVISGNDVVFTPSPDFNGTAVFSYAISDGTDSGTANVTVNVILVNDAPPVANDDTYSTLEDTTLTIPVAGILANDTDVDGDPKTALLVSNVSNGSLSLNANGSFTYTPNTNYNGTDSFTYAVTDGMATGNVATVTINITPVNDVPAVNAQSVTTIKNTAEPITLTGSDVDNDPLTFSIVSGPTNGALSGLNAADGTVTYTPNTNFLGRDSFTFQVNDGTTNSALAAVTITVTPVGGSTSCGLSFADGAGTSVSAYPVGGNIYVNLTDSDANTSASSVQTRSVTVNNLSRGDVETITLTETGTNTGVFHNTAPLPSSGTTGLAQQDGSLNGVAGDVLAVSHVDPLFGDQCSANATMQAPPVRNLALYLSDPGQSLDRVDPVATGDNTTAQTVVLGLSAATITVAATNSSSTTSGTSLTFSHTPGSGTNRFLLVGVGVGATSLIGSAGTVSGVSYGGIAMTLAGSISPPSSAGIRSYIYGLVNPSPGPANVVVNVSGSSSIAAGATTFNNVNQTTPLGTYVSTSADSGTTGSTIASSASGELVFATAAWDEGLSNQSVSPAAGQTQLWNMSGLNYVSTTASTKPGAASVTNTFTAGDSQEWAMGAVPIRPATVGTNVVTFAQTPGFCQNFALPSGGTVTITNFITITNGSMPANPNITATLKYGATSIIVLTNPAYSAGNSNLVWTGTLTDAVTIPAGQTVDLVISNSQPDVSFRIDYDSAPKPSKITLPATTVIAVNTLGVYDAPYPGGDFITTPVAETTAYVRATVSDPFGAYDITSLGLVIDGPGVSGDVSTTLSNSSVVASDSCSKTFEFPWVTTSAVGGYTITATASEGTEGVTALEMVSVTVTPGNHPPVANAQSVTTPEDAAKMITLTGSDVDSDPLTFSIVNGPANGVLSGLNPTTGTVTYTPDTNFNGGDSITFRAHDGLATGNLATVTINVTPVNDPPIAVNDGTNTLEDVSVTINVLANDSDVEGSPLSITGTSTTNGTAVISGNNVIFRAATNFNGTVVLSYTVSDGTNSATAKVTVTVIPVNDAPIAYDDSYTTQQDVPLTIPALGIVSNDIDVDGDVLSTWLVANVSNGSLSLNTDGSFTYTPNTNYNGSDSFTYRVSDGLDPVVAILQQNTSGGNKMDIKLGQKGAQSFRHGTAGGAGYTISKVVLHLSRETESPNANLNFNIGSGINSGAIAGSSMTIAPSSITNTSSGNSFQTYEIVYGTPVGPLTAGTTYYLNLECEGSNGKTIYAEYAGSSTYANGTYFKDDNNDGKDIWFQIYGSTNSGGSDTATVTINLTPVNDVPIANDDNTNTLEDVSVTINVLDNDSDPDGTPLTITGTSITNGTAVISGTSVVFTPSTNFNGTVVFSYTVSDGTNSATASVTVMVTPVNDDPIANNDTYTTLEDVPLTIPAAGVLTNDLDVDGDTLTAVLESNVSHGSLSLNPGGSFTYTPATNYVGDDSFTYRAYDGTAASTSATVTITVLRNTPLSLSSAVMIPGGFSFQLSGAPASAYVIEASTNLTDWTAISTNSGLAGSVVFTDTEAANFSQRYYRAMAR